LASFSSAFRGVVCVHLVVGAPFGVLTAFTGKVSLLSTVVTLWRGAVCAGAAVSISLAWGRVPALIAGAWARGRETDIGPGSTGVVFDFINGLFDRSNFKSHLSGAIRGNGLGRGHGLVCFQLFDSFFGSSGGGVLGSLLKCVFVISGEVVSSESLCLNGMGLCVLECCRFLCMHILPDLGA